MNMKLKLPIQRTLDEIKKELEIRDVKYIPTVFDDDPDHALIIINENTVLKLSYWIHGMWDYEDVMVDILNKFNEEIEESEPIFMEQISDDVKRIIKTVEKYF